MKFTTTTAGTNTNAGTAKKEWHAPLAPLNKVTPISKITAAVVVIALPFIGFFLGVQFATGGELPFANYEAVE